MEEVDKTPCEKVEGFLLLNSSVVGLPHRKKKKNTFFKRRNSPLLWIFRQEAMVMSTAGESIEVEVSYSS